MKQALTFPIVEDLLISEKLILTYTLLYLFIPSFCKHLLSTQFVPGLGRRVRKSINQISSCSGGTVFPEGWTDWETDNYFKCVKAQKPLTDICPSRTLKWQPQASLYSTLSHPNNTLDLRALLYFLFLESSRNRRIKKVAPVMRNTLVSMKEKQYLITRMLWLSYYWISKECWNVSI